VQQSPDAESLTEIIRSFPEIVPQFDEDLEEALEELDAEADPEKRKDLTRDALAIIGDYRSLLEDPALLKLQELAEGEFGLDIVDSLNVTLGTIEHSLSA
jgi:hypothetical protein